MGGRAGRRNDGAEEVVLALVRGHAGELLRFARRFSLCADDAQDAYQRALEILVRRLREASVDNPLSYLRTIVRHEAFQVRVERERLLQREELDVEAAAGTEPGDDPLERAERFERLAHTAEALQRLKPQELKALTLRAEGLSYREICEREGWSYTRCNRVVTEGRRALLERLGAIESGAECARWLPLLSAFADGEADARAVVELRPHLRSCTACRATLRELHDAGRGLRAIVPPELLVPALVAAAPEGGVARHAEALIHAACDRVAATAHGTLERVTGAAHGAFERAAAPVLRLQGAVEALPGGKVAAVAASTVAVAGGGAAIERAATEPVDSRRPARVEQVASAGTATPPSRTVALSTASAKTPAALVPATALPAGPEWLGATPRRDAAQRPLDEFGFEGPVPSRTAARAPAPPRLPASGRRTGGEREAARSGRDRAGRTSAAETDTAGRANAAAGPSQPPSAAASPPAATGSPSPPAAPRSEPEFPAPEF